MPAKEFDICLYGATGFTGVYTMEHFARAANSTMKGLKIAIAGRNKDKIEAAAENAGISTKKYPVIIADTNDIASLDAMCKRTKVLLSVVGPFIFQQNVVDACVRNDCSLVDITGETGYVREYIEKHHEEAKRKGIFLLSSCAFDSLPPELTNMYLHQYAKRNNLGPLPRVEVAWSFENATLFSGGTMYTTQQAIRNMKWKDIHPLSILPSCTVVNKNDAPEEYRDYIVDSYPMQFMVKPSWNFQKWTAPLVLSACNEKVVRKNNILRGNKSVYLEVLADKNILVAIFSWFVLFVYAPLLALPIFGDILLKLTSYAPGKGPDRDASAKTTFKVFAAGFRDEKDSSKQVRAVMNCPWDAYRGSGILAAEVAAAIATGEIDQGEDAFEKKRSKMIWSKGGALTPGCVVGESLMTRLKNYNITWEFIESNNKW